MTPSGASRSASSWSPPHRRRRRSRSLPSGRPSLLPLALPAAAAQAGEPGRRQRPVGFGLGDAAPGAQHGMGPGQLMGRGADVHVGVVEHEIVEVDQLAVEPQTGAGVGEVGAGDPAVADRAFGEPLVEPGERILGGGERAGEFWPTAADRGSGSWVARS